MLSVKLSYCFFQVSRHQPNTLHYGFFLGKDLNTNIIQRYNSNSHLLRDSYSTDRLNSVDLNKRSILLGEQPILTDHEQMSYSDYITQQFNKLRDATLNKPLSSNFLSTEYPSKTNSVREPILGNIKYDGRSSHSHCASQNRPHSCINFRRDDYSSTVHHNDNDYNRARKSDLDVATSIGVSRLPEYVEPPKYTHRAEYFRSSNHEGSAPPVVLRDTSALPNDRPISVYDKQEITSKLLQEKYNELIQKNEM